MTEQTDLLHANATIFELLLDWFPDPIQSVDGKGDLIYVNRRATEMLGYSRDELLGMSICDIYAPELREDVESGFALLRKQGTLSVTGSILVGKQGNRIPVEIRSFAVYDDQAEFLRTFSIFRDLREMKRLQENLMHASRLTALGELAASITHDIGNPLTVIRVSGELLQAELERLATTDKEEAAALAESLEYVDKATEKIEKLVGQLRNLAANNDEEPNIVDLRDTIDDALFMVKSKVTRGRVTVHVETPDVPCDVLGHSTQLEQVFMNLFGNACDALKDRPNPTIHVSIQESSDAGSLRSWLCTIRDNGVGIPDDDREQVFNSFFTTKKKGEGTGLGLAIVHSIIHDHGGSIDMDSVVEEGTTFAIHFPAAQVSDAGV